MWNILITIPKNLHISGIWFLLFRLNAIKNNTHIFIVDNYVTYKDLTFVQTSLGWQAYTEEEERILLHTNPQELETLIVQGVGDLSPFFSFVFGLLLLLLFWKACTYLFSKSGCNAPEKPQLYSGTLAQPQGQRAPDDLGSAILSRACRPWCRRRVGRHD